MNGFVPRLSLWGEPGNEAMYVHVSLECSFLAWKLFPSCDFYPLLPLVKCQHTYMGVILPVMHCLYLLTFRKEGEERGGGEGERGRGKGDGEERGREEERGKRGGREGERGKRGEGR